MRWSDCNRKTGKKESRKGETETRFNCELVKGKSGTHKKNRNAENVNGSPDFLRGRNTEGLTKTLNVGSKKRMSLFVNGPPRIVVPPFGRRRTKNWPYEDTTSDTIAGNRRPTKAGGVCV